MFDYKAESILSEIPFCLIPLHYSTVFPGGCQVISSHLEKCFYEQQARKAPYPAALFQALLEVFSESWAFAHENGSLVQSLDLMLVLEMLLELWKDCGFVFVRDGDGLRYLEAGSVFEKLYDF